MSGESAKDRPALQAMINYARESDAFVFYSIDRLARDLKDIISTLDNKRVSISFLAERLTFSAEADDAFAKLQLQMMGAFAEFERNIIRKRQAEGISKTKARGVYKGTKKRVDCEKVRQMKADDYSTYKIAEEMSISRMSVHRILNTEAV